MASDELLARIRLNGAVPRHVAIIMDGNGRWARERHLPRALGHRSGMKSVREAVEEAQGDTAAAKKLLSRQAQKRIRPTTLGADKGYHTKGFVASLRARNIAPHIARIKDRCTPGLDARTTRHASYTVSQQKRKRVEEIFGWFL